jgi:hypothetical protein
MQIHTRNRAVSLQTMLLCTQVEAEAMTIAIMNAVVAEDICRFISVMGPI